MKSSSVYLLTAQDCALLDRYKLIVDAIGQVFGNSCECVLHSLADLEHSVIHIHNGMKTGRVLGSPITDKALMLLKNCESLHQDITPVYQTVARNGSPMRSTTIIIRNNDRIPIGFLCINFGNVIVRPLPSITAAGYERRSGSWQGNRRAGRTVFGNVCSEFG